MIDGPYKLPEGWRWVRLGEACQINPRRPRLDVNPTAEVTFVPMSAVDAELGIIYTPEIKPFSAVKTGYTYFEENDVLFAKITPCMENGKSAVARGLLNNIGFGSTEFHVLRPIDSVLSEWIWLYIRKKDFRELAKAAFRGGVGQQRVPREFLQEVYIPLPPLNEQQLIVAKVEMLMEQVCEARRLRQKAVEDADRLWQSVLADTFPRPGADLPSNWRWMRLGDICETKMGGTPSTKNAEYWNPPEIVWVTPEDLEKSVFNKVLSSKRHISQLGLNRSSAKLFPRETILISTTATIGKVGISRIQLSANQQITGIIPNNNVEPCIVGYYFLFLGEIGLKQLGGTATATHINQASLRSLTIPIPPREEQRRIVAYLETTHEKIISLKNSQAQFGAELQCLEQSILDSAFKGEL
ncbi:restriction endonuclease subunit S [Acetomicrobium sp.]|uniref:restriction endonuclease subunit S n=1 Tax=Acetomicrobium sp. TaxID=1872099 RepID=UPI002871AA6A|nr:restriction endonuclease subunit S [Acetomicrobium sp.]MDR9768815.1 restriction endonuclease subunit S [Acetomicrobium sp.]